MEVKLTYKGMDNWDRPVYEDENGKLWKDVNPSEYSKPDLCTSLNNEFYGEPDTNMRYMERYKDATLIFSPERITW